MTHNEEQSGREVAPTKFDFDPAQVCGECFTVRSVSGACACVGGAGA